MTDTGCVPTGKGVSSSAAVEVAAMTAILAALNVQVRSSSKLTKDLQKGLDL